MMDDIDSYDLQEKIEILEAKVKKLENILKFHKLDKIPLKYTKAFPTDDEYPYFEAPGFKEYTTNVSRLNDYQDHVEKACLPKDPKEYELAKQRMRDLAAKAKEDGFKDGRHKHSHI